MRPKAIAHWRCVFRPFRAGWTEAPAQTDFIAFFVVLSFFSNLISFDLKHFARDRACLSMNLQSALVRFQQSVSHPFRNPLFMHCFGLETTAAAAVRAGLDFSGSPYWRRLVKRQLGRVGRGDTTTEGGRTGVPRVPMWPAVPG